jgi:hypothetical protein
LPFGTCAVSDIAAQASIAQSIEALAVTPAPDAIEDALSTYDEELDALDGGSGTREVWGRLALRPCSELARQKPCPVVSVHSIFRTRFLRLVGNKMK